MTARRPQPRLLLLLLAALCAALGAVFLALPPSVGTPSAPPLAADSFAALPRIAPGDPALAEELVLANAFSSRRAPPSVRYTPPEASGDSVTGMLTDSASGSVPELPATDPLLLGTVVSGRVRQALLQLDPLAGTPRLYSEGDRDGGYRIVSIAPRAVVLVGPRGRVVLRLELPEGRP